MSRRPSPYELWIEAGGETPGSYDRDRYLELMREHGHLTGPGDEGYEEAPGGLPCGWPDRSDDNQGDPMTTAKPPMTWPQIRKRLDEIAPDPASTGHADEHDIARIVARSLAVTAQRRRTRNLSGYFGSSNRLAQREWQESIAALCAEFAALHLLMGLIEADPERARVLAGRIRDAWDDGGMIGELLWEHLEALGIDGDEVARLEEAWQALPEVAAPENPAGDGPCCTGCGDGCACGGSPHGEAAR